MKRLFGEYLIATGLATQEAVLEGLIEQLRAVPGTAELVHRHQLLKADELFRILATQQRSGGDFRTTGADLGLWTPQVAERASALISQIRRPLGEILVKNGVLTLTQLASALDGYVEELSHTNAPEAVSPAFVAKNLPVAKPKFTAAPPLEPTIAKEFAQTFAKQFAPALRTTLQVLSEKNLQRSELISVCRQAIADLIGIDAAARFIGAQRSATIAKATASVFEEILRSENFGAIKAMRETLSLATPILSGLAQCLDQFQDESKIDSDPNLNDLTERFWLKLASTQALCQKAVAA